jgi:hypothetical protein
MAPPKLIPRTPYLTLGYGEELEQQITKTVQGMAYFANSGPFATSCGGCAFYGAWRQIRGRDGTLKPQRAPRACAKFQELTGKIGGDIPKETASCKYFQRKEEAK